MMKTFALALLLSSQAHAFTLSILTNQDSQAKANEVKSFMQSLPPFKYMSPSELKITVTKIDNSEIAQSCNAIKLKYTKEELRSIQYWAEQNGAHVTSAEQKNLSQGFSISRNVTCDKEALQKLAERYGGDRTLLVIEREGSGGSGGDVPTMTTNARPTVGIHELLHTFGFGDEYKYSPTEALLYCSQAKWANVAKIPDTAVANNTDALAKVGAEIPWLAALGSTPDISTGTKLGTARFGRNGLYPAHVCDEANVKTWVASPYISIMQSIQSTFIPNAYWPTIFSAMGLSGSRAKSLLKQPEQPPALRLMKPTAEELSHKGDERL